MTERADVPGSGTSAGTGLPPVPGPSAGRHLRPAATSAPGLPVASGSARLVDATLHLDGYRNDSPDVTTEARRWTSGARGPLVEDPDLLAAADLTAFADTCLDLGARVLAIASATAETAAVQASVKTASEQVTAAVDRATATADETVRRTAEQLKITANDVGERLTAEITRLLGGEHPELLTKLTGVLDGVGRTLDRQVADSFAQANAALAEAAERRHAEVTALLADYRRDVAVRLAEETTARDVSAEVKGRTSLKGFDYENAVHAVCGRIADGMGEEYTATGTRAGRLPRNMKGDGVFTIGGGIARIVVEMHDGASKEWSSYLTEAERNRGAAASIGLVRRLDDNDGHLLRVIGPKRLIVAFDPAEDDDTILRTVALLMRTVVLTTTGRSGAEEIITAKEAIDEAMATLKDLDEAKRSASAITRHAENVDRTLTKVMTAVDRQLRAAAAALAPQAASPGTPGSGADGESGSGDGETSGDGTSGEGETSGDGGETA